MNQQQLIRTRWKPLKFVHAALMRNDSLRVEFNSYFLIYYKLRMVVVHTAVSKSTAPPYYCLKDPTTASSGSFFSSLPSFPAYATLAEGEL